METTFTLFNNYARNNQINNTNRYINDSTRYHIPTYQTTENAEKINFNERPNRNQIDQTNFGAMGVKREGRTCKNSDKEDGDKNGKEGIEDWYSCKRIKTGDFKQAQAAPFNCDTNQIGAFEFGGAKATGQMEFIRTGSESAEDNSATERTAFTTECGSVQSPDFFNDTIKAFNEADKENEIRG